MASKPYKPCPCHERMGNDFYFLPKGSCLFTDGDCVGGAHRHGNVGYDEHGPAYPEPPLGVVERNGLSPSVLVAVALVIAACVMLLWPLH